MRRKARASRSTDWFSRVTDLCAAPVFLASTLALMGMAFDAPDAAIRPHVGAVLDFRNSRSQPGTPHSPGALPVHARFATRLGNADAFCTIEPSAAAAGGSLVVERILPGRPDGYLVHWVGIRTSWHGDSCGPVADLFLTRRDLETLAIAGGGYVSGP